MESHPKIMTVSYGTFSCTLEGFDDPFTTMQLVAEYFRKLAQKDRYFGGEPLKPDHDALHQIAKDANPYQVDAEVTDTGITLRKADVLDSDEAARPVPKEAAAKPAQPNPAPFQTDPAVETPAAEPTDTTPLFASTRSISAKRQERAANAPAKPATRTKEDSPFVEAAVFSSRRGVLAPAKSEPTLPASALLDAEDDSEEDTFAFDDTELNIFEDDAEANSFPKAEAEADEEPDQLAVELQALAEEEALAAEEEEAARYREDAEAAAQAVTSILAVENADEIARDAIKREEEALERLLETTNSKLETPAHSRKSNALKRLKAAVAATEAERRLRTPPAQTRTERPAVKDLKVDPSEFKNRMTKAQKDHDEAIQLTRPIAKSGTPRARNPIATLILGKDQRVASDEAAEAADRVKKPEADGQSPAVEFTTRASRSETWADPRPDLKIVRPSMADDLLAEVAEPAGPEGGDGFEEFARKIGANTLHELLEASAAYLSIVENEPRFSQERIIQTIGDYMEENNISEDAANRSLNRLMRDGRILRVKQDSYTISKSARHGFKDRMTA
ncbi:hypothetical protein [Neptunicoccus cionae]|uniref:Lipoprotein n=1 Tax=Neptunicoccus cionae TaxID=2035344 RepID=A0A916QTN6_9RHOB|nr:hypothetical protein [Amylibacter cionae]GGA10132.1 hypothetical protein GCM10011498_07760 [Amylibacter cionae]